MNDAYTRLSAARFFASDNAAPVHPEIMRALENANIGHALSYGADALTAHAARMFDELFGAPVHTYFAYNGTGANILALMPLLSPYGAIICSEDAHIFGDEAGASERVIGAKLYPVRTPGGKLTPALIASRMGYAGSFHHAQPQAVSIAQATECGTLYTVQEVRDIADFCHAHGMRLHMDGARIGPAAAALGVSVAELTRGAGVDTLSFGGTKNGLMFGEAVISFIDEPAPALPFLRKQITQLASKMRYIAAQYIALLTDSLWLRCARAANESARRLAQGLSDLPGARLLYPVQANMIFVELGAERARRMCEAAFFHIYDEHTGLARIVTSFDTTDADVDALLAAARASVSR